MVRTDSAGASAPRLEMRGIRKQFPGVLANDNVHVKVMPGEIHALLGENGAGKSTLVKMIYGIMAPDLGEMLFDGEPVRVANPRAARKLGIGMVFQHFSLFEALTVLENIALGLDSNISQRDLEAEIRRVLDIYGLKLDPKRIVSTLSVGERQRIEIVRALLLNPRLLIMDEPTSVLTPQEVEQLFETLAQARGERLFDPLHLPQAARDHRALRQRDDFTRRPGRRGLRSEAGDFEEHGRIDDRRQPEGDRSPGRADSRRGKILGSKALDAEARRLRRRVEGHQPLGARRRNPGRRGRRGQRAERIDGGLERRARRASRRPR